MVINLSFINSQLTLDAAPTHSVPTGIPTYVYTNVRTFTLNAFILDSHTIRI